MENMEKNKSKILEAAIKSKPEVDETEFMKEQDVNMKIAVKFYQEQTRPYFSSPCMLSEMEDQEDTFNF
ncbi:hypothetical protein AQPE_4342 [Aquipluma nitroreducens]|uniref:Uncharacterized protein n=1 Tax=Aquipluma nitroreducens TaxID=2010828 RepID=A0A5K7SEY8_9BACT|nr:hypothetical protein [Aquipluma nitroreducens]BBE20151.1 hypothetical protein AQPE_4342 [Aquipluma nitroreducens]